ncbi:unnamed protein product [marine sediment metagenome]|uniref:Uncharacterized protein n=1 Tax=marine sediment metagenome TaxID=412755 RepID=X0YAV7_9ZZZZ
MKNLKIQDIRTMLIRQNEHCSHAWPTDTDRYLELETPLAVNTWTDWAIITDNLDNKLSDLALTQDMFLESAIVEDVSTKDVVIMGQISYGADKFLIAEQRYIAGDNQVGTVQTAPFASPRVPHGEEIYARAKSSAPSVTVRVSLRYYHDETQ